MHQAIEELQVSFLDPATVRASHQIMGLDTQLIRDGTYFVIFDGETIVGSGGWSYRATLFGGDAGIVARAPEMLNPVNDAARIRAMYTKPSHVRRGIARKVLTLCEAAGYKMGFRRTELMATLAGEPLYLASGYHPVERVMSQPVDGIRVPLIRMTKQLNS